MVELRRVRVRVRVGVRVERGERHLVELRSKQCTHVISVTNVNYTGWCRFSEDSDT